MVLYDNIEKHYTKIATDFNVNPQHIVRNPFQGIEIKTPKEPESKTKPNANAELGIKPVKSGVRFVGFESQ